MIINMISNEDEHMIEVCRKYSLVPGTVKSEIFCRFEEGYSPREARYLYRNLRENYDNPKTFANNIRRYYYDWKQAQDSK